MEGRMKPGKNYKESERKEGMNGGREEERKDDSEK